METIVGAIQWGVANYQTVIAAAVAILGGVIGICMLIPGEQPEKSLQGVLNFLTKFSKK